MFSMRYLGDENGPAPRLHDIRPENPRALLDEVLRGVEALAGAGVVHSDLSAYNILVYNGQPWFIDFSEAIRVDRTGSVPWKRLEEARVGLERGMGALRVYFGRLGVEVESEPFTSRILRSLDKFGVLHV
jgi:RIO kinase 1